MKILITGGFGFIGYHLAARLLAAGDSVILMGRKSPRHTAEFQFLRSGNKGRLEFVEGEIEEEIHEYLNVHTDVELVYHLAARKATTATRESVPGSLMAMNFDTDIEVLAACECVAESRPIKLVFLSSGEIYGDSFLDQKPCSELTPSIIRPWDRSYLYLASKIAGEMMLKHGNWHFNWNIVRLQNPYGPMMGDDTLIGKICIMAANLNLDQKAGSMEIGAAFDTRPFIFAPDAAEILEAIGKRSSHMHLFNVAGFLDHGIMDVAREIAKHAEPGALDIFMAPHTTMHTGSHRRMDCGQVAKEFQWKPRTSIEDGLRDTFRFYAMKESLRRSLGSIGV